MASPQPRRQQGVALLEALIGILIFSIGILALMALQAQSIRNTLEAKYRNEASYLASQIIGTMWVDRSNIATYVTPSGTSGNLAQWQGNVAALLPGVTIGGTNAPTIAVAGRQVTVTIFWQMPGTDSAQRRLSVVAQMEDT